MCGRRRNVLRGGGVDGTEDIRPICECVWGWGWGWVGVGGCGCGWVWVGLGGCGWECGGERKEKEKESV